MTPWRPIGDDYWVRAERGAVLTVKAIPRVRFGYAWYIPEPGRSAPLEGGTALTQADAKQAANDVAWDFV